VVLGLLSKQTCDHIYIEGMPLKTYPLASGILGCPYHL
jgi:hypothetical protein